MKFLLALLLFSSLAAAAAVARQNATDLTPFTFLGRCDVPDGYGVPTLEELGGLSSHSTKKCQAFSGSPTAASVALLGRSIAKRRACCVKKHGAGKCNTLRKLGNAEVVICGEAGWCHPCGMLALLVADIGKTCKWGHGGEVFAAGTWNVKANGHGSITVFGV